MKLFKHAHKDVHFEFEARLGNETPHQEVEVYIGGWFLCSVDIKDISPEAREYLFDEEEACRP